MIPVIRLHEIEGTPVSIEVSTVHSTTQFEVGLDHRYKQAVTAKITAKLAAAGSRSDRPADPGAVTE